MSNRLRRIPVVAVLGGASLSSDDTRTRCEHVGRLLAKRKAHLLTGGGPGVMECVSKAYVECPDRVPEGHTIGIIPAASIDDPKTPKSGYPNPYIEIPIFTHLASSDGTHFNSRNNINILTADVIVVLDGGSGTSAEVELLCRFKKRDFAISFATEQERFPNLDWSETDTNLEDFIEHHIQLLTSHRQITWRTEMTKHEPSNPAKSGIDMTTSGNVDTNASESDRVRVMWGLISSVVEDLDAHRTDAQKLNIKKFLLHIAWHEGDKLRFRTQQPSGPGRSFFQFEPAKAKDAVDHAENEGLMSKLTSSSGETERVLLDAAAALSLGSPWPANNLIEKKLGNTDPSDLFACYMTRIALKRITQAIPDSNQEHAEYWADHWKVSFSSADERMRQIRAFKSKADTVDGLIPSN